MKRQDVSGVERLAVDSTGGSGTSDVNLTQIDGTAASVNNGTADNGTLRVTVASDSTGQIKLAAGSAVIGHVITDTGSTTVVTGTVAVSAASLPLPTGASTLAEQQTQTTALQVIDDLPLSQASTTSGQKGVLCQGAVTTAAPSYTTAQTNPLSLTTAGALRVDGSAATQPVSGTVTANQGTSPWIAAGGGTAGTAASGVVTVQGIASMTPVQVSQATGTNLHAVLDAGTALVGKVGIDQTTPGTTNGVGIEQIGSTTVATGNGVVGTGVQRVAIASDNTAFSVNATIGANSSVNVNQLAGTTTSVNSGNKDNGTLRVVLATDQPALTNNLLVTATGNIASDGVDSGNPLKIGMLAKTADITAVADADRVDAVGTTLGKQITVPYVTPALSWSYAAAAGGLVTTGGVTAKAAGTGAQRNYVTRVQAINSHQTIGTEVVIRDGAAGTVLWRGWAQFAGGGCSAVFDPPLRGSAATLIEIAEVTTTATAGVLVNLQGYTAAE